MVDDKTESEAEEGEAIGMTSAGSTLCASTPAIKEAEGRGCEGAGH